MVSSPDINGLIKNLCQLVLLDTLIHSSQKFIERDTLRVSFEGDILKSCTLISETEALVFTQRKVILVCLINQIQKDLSYPRGLGCISHSLNMVKDIPHMIVTTNEFTETIT